jgi:hypothetical protein
MLIVAFILLIFVILRLWPPPAEDGMITQQGSNITFLLWTFWISNEVRLPLLALSGGALGGVIKGLTALSKHYAQNDLKLKWGPWYILRPFIGAGLGIAIYLLFRAGLTQVITADMINPLTVAGLAILIGIFAEEAMVMLQGIAGHLFAKPPVVGRTYYTGRVAPVSGIYMTVHPEGCSGSEDKKEEYTKTFTKGQTIEKHTLCGEPVEWELIRETKEKTKEK